VEFVPAGLDYLRRVRATIFTCDLQRHGTIAWGDDVLAAMPHLRGRDIPGADAIRLVMNRLVEASLPGPDHEHAALRSGYQVVKTLLDAAGAVLAFRGRYVSGYGERPEALRRLLEDDAGLRAAIGAPDAFVALVARAADCKAQPTRHALERFAGPATRARVLGWARTLWVWQIGARDGRAPLDVPQAVEAYLRQERPATRARGWVKYAWHPLRPAGVTDWRRLPRLMRRGSPQALAYAAALLAQEGRASGQRALEEQAAALLPMRAPAANALERAGELWQWLVRNN
jgi:hypothetical protein